MSDLPPGQKESDSFPRFGLPAYANRFPTITDRIEIAIGGDLDGFVLGNQLNEMERIETSFRFSLCDYMEC